MRFHFDDQAAADPNQPLAPPYPDLLALLTFRMRRDDVAGHVYISGFIRNIGNEAIRKPFKVALGATITQQSTSSFEIIYSTEKRITINEYIAVGEQIETRELRVPLVYRDQGNARYDIEMIVDIENDILELRSSNNRSNLEWYFYRQSEDAEIVNINNLTNAKYEVKS